MPYLEGPSPIQSPLPSPRVPEDTLPRAPPVLIVFILIVLVCFFMGFCFIYLCRCCIVSIFRNWDFQGAGSGGVVGRSDEDSPDRGLDQSLLQNFPTFIYSSVKEYRKQKIGLECAICLVEFEEESWLRLITTCNHVFHQECIDLWLLSHKTCPVCRRDLDSLPQKSPDIGRTSNNESFTDEEVHIDVKEGEGASDGDNIRVERQERVSQLRQVGDLDKFSRSHSTGHSVVLIREEDEGNGEGGQEEEGEDKYTLRLPDHIRAKLIRGHQYAKSCVTYGEMTKRTGACSNCGFVQELPQPACTSRKDDVEPIY